MKRTSRLHDLRRSRKDYRIIVLFAVGLFISLQDFLPRFEYTPEQESVPAYIFQLPMVDRMRPLFFLPVNINRADAELLETIPGIGPTLSRRIIALRDERKGFHNIRELLDVPGIGPAKFAGIKGHCSL
ncbi:MAG: helix-hairpin-helix domain-containing protein [Pseudomonadota bacterium]